MTKDKSLSLTCFSRWVRFHREVRSSVLSLTGPIGQPLRKLEIVAAGIGYLKHSFYAGTTYSPTHLIWFVAEGRIKCDYGKGPKELRAGEMVICPAGGPHWIELATTKAVGCWFHLRDVPRWRHLGSDEPRIRACVEVNTLKFLLELCHVESMLSQVQSTQMTLHLAELISLVFLRRLSHSLNIDQGLSHRRLEELWIEVDASLRLPWTVQKLAAQVHMSKSYLHKLTLRHFGAHPMEMVSRLRMRKAETLLIHTNFSQEDIANEIGYGTAYSFSHAFLRHAGVRPGAFRHRFAG